MRRLSGDAGAVTTLLVVLVGTGVLMGAGVVVLDYGALLAERRQVQNGADAAALSLALGCAETDDCSPTAADAAPWVDVNDTGGDLTGVAAVHSVCAPSGQATCPDPPGGGDLTSCLPVDVEVAPLLLGSVEVRVGSDVPSLLGDAMGSDGGGAAACARASFGPVGAVEEAFLITVPACAVTAFDSPVELVVTDPEPPPDATCAGGVLTSLAVDGEGRCRVASQVGAVVDAAPVDPVADCLGLLADGAVVWLAVHRALGGPGDGPTVVGFTGFVPATDPVRACAPLEPDPGPDPDPVVPGPVPVPEPEPEPAPEQLCVAGSFVRGTPPGGRIGPGGDYGARAVQLTG